MNMIRSLAVMAAIGVSAGTAHADNVHGNRYVGATVGMMEIDSDIGSADVNQFELRAGGFINPYLAAEARAGVGVTSEKVGNTDLDVKLRHLVGGYIRGGALLEEKFFPYLLLGFSRVDIEASAFGNSANNAETDSSYGIGVDASVANMTFTLEYVKYAEIEGDDVSSINIGLISTF